MDDSKLIWEAYSENEDSRVQSHLPDKEWICYGILQRQDMAHIEDRHTGVVGQAFAKLLRFIMHHGGGPDATLDLEFGEEMMDKIDEYGDSGAGGYKGKEYFERIQRTSPRIMKLISTEAYTHLMVCSERDMYIVLYLLDE